MESAIRRGKLLRQILKQDQLSPLPATCQMAWLVAFNNHLLDDIDIEQVATHLQHIYEQVRASDLNLNSPKESWLNAISGWLNNTPLDSV